VKLIWLLLAPGAALLGDTLTLQISSTFPSPDGAAIMGAAINDLGQVTLWTSGTGSERGYGSSFFRDSSGAFTHFAFPASNGGQANAINNSGQITGRYYPAPAKPPSPTYGYLHSASGTFIDLAPLVNANGINNNGTIVGDSYIRDTNGNAITISFPGASSYTSVEGINDAGQVVGEYCCVNGGTVPFIRGADGTFTGLGSLAGAKLLGINALGQVLGIFQGISFVRNADGTLSAIVFPGGVIALGMNNKSQVAGILGDGQGFVGTLVPGSTLIVTTTSPLPSGAVGEYYSQSLNASGGVPPYTWAAVSSAPPGLTVSSGGGIAGIPTSPGTFSFTVRMSDSSATSITQTFKLTIAGALSIVTASPLPPARVGVPYSQTLIASGGTLPYSWSLSAGSSLPAGLTMSPLGVITGTPTTAGMTSFTVSMYDHAGVTVTQSLSLTVTAPLAITASSPLPSGTVGVSYSQVLGAGGGTIPYNWSLDSGSLPAGLTLSLSGVIAGIPVFPGVANFAVRVTDSASASVTQALSLVISPSGVLSIDTSSPLPAATVGVAYSQVLAATGGVAPYGGWTISSGSLPPGIALTTLGTAATGLLSGTPAASGAYSFTVQVTDSTGMVAGKPFSLTVNPAAISVSSDGVLNSASYAGGAVAPGEIIVIYGSGMGPGTLVGLQLDSRGYVSSSLAGTQVLFDGVPAPLIYTQAGQVSAVVPYAVSGNATTQLRVFYQGQTSIPISLPVTAAAPGIFTSDSSGRGQGSIVNQDGSINSPDNPAPVGSVVAVYATGEGQTNPGGIDGKPAGLSPPLANQPVTATIGGLNAPVQYAGGVFGLVAGVMQVNVLIPQGVSVGSSVPIVLSVGGTATQANITLAIK
jgi:uncharacterized protein (TIGR03437 family)